MRFLIVLCAAALFSSCATKPKTWSAPDATKVNAATKRLSAAIEKASATTARAEAKVAEAQASSDRVAASSASVLIQVHDLEQLVPPELKPRVAELKASIDAQIVEEGKLSTAISGARGEIGTLRQDLVETTAAKDELKAAQTKYQLDAALIARDATNERNFRIAAEKQLSKEKWMRLLWKIGGGFLVIAIVVIIGLFIAGKWSIKGARAYFQI